MSLKAAKTYPLELFQSNFQSSKASWCSDFDVLVSVKRVKADLLLTYVIRSDLANWTQVDLLKAYQNQPAQVAPPKRLNELWKHTCFEAFIAFGASNAYLEFNASREGHWNLYFFTGYRQGMKELVLGQISEPKKILEEHDQHGDKVEYKIEFKVSLPSEELEISKLGLAVILERSPLLAPPSENYAYFALSHTNQKPDFHLADAWVKIEG